MTVSTLAACAMAVGMLLGLSAAKADANDPLGAWREGVKVRPVPAGEGMHSIHSYYLACPESPDGRCVLFYTSSTPEGHTGELRIVDRATNRETIIARDVTVEDAHRAACQQWALGGRAAVFHDLRDGNWVVACVDVRTREERVLARGYQVGFGEPTGPLVPIYGPHWAPGDHRDLDLLDVETARVRTAATVKDVQAAYPRQIAKEFAERPVSVFFPVLSPDRKRVFFKMATPAGGDFRSTTASHRALMIGYDLDKPGFLFFREKWGHPAWLGDSRTILEVGHLRIDSNSGAASRIPRLPSFPGSHPSGSPDGRLFVTDTSLETFGGGKGQWGVAVGRMDGGRYEIIHRFDNSQGAKSWRRSQPHPVFNADGTRIYFNVSSGPWTRLYVAERG